MLIFLIVLVHLLTLFALYIFVRGARMKRRQAAWTLGAITVAAALWAGGNAFEIGDLTQEGKLFWAKAQYLGIVALPPLWLIFVLYTLRLTRLPLNRAGQIMKLFVIPIITLLLVWTNEQHGLIWRRVELASFDQIVSLSLEYGIWFWVHTLYSYFLLLFGTVLLLNTWWKEQETNQYQALVLLLGMVPVWLANIAYVTGWIRLPGGADITPVAFTLTVFVYAVGTFRFHLVQLVPLALHTLLDNLSDPVIIIDQDNRIVELNPAAERLTKFVTESLVDHTLEDILGEQVELVRQVTGTEAIEHMIELPTADGQRPFELSIAPLVDRNQLVGGKLLVLHDVTRWRMSEEELRRNQWLLSKSEQLAHVGSWLYDTRADKIIWSDELYRIHGFLPQAFPVTRETGLQWLHPEDSLSMAEVIQGLEQQDEVALEWRILTQDGQLRYVHGRMSWNSDDAGERVQLVGIVQDVTQLRQSELALQALNQSLEQRVAERTRTLELEVLEHTRAQEQIRYLASLLDIVSDAIISTDAAFRIRTWNKAAERIYGYAASEVLGQPIPAVLQTEFRHDTAEEVGDRFARSGAWQGEVTQRRKDGQSLNIMSSVEAIRDNDVITGAVAVNRDVTIARQAEVALYQSEERYRTLVERTHDLIQSVDTDGRFLFANNAWFELLGYARDELPSLTLWDIVEPEEHPHCRQIIANMAAGEESQALHTTLRTKAGARLSVDGFSVARQEDGVFVGTYTFLHDMTARVEAAQALQRAEARYRHLFEEAPVMYVITRNEQGNPIIADCNELFASTLGYDRAELIERPLANFYAPSSRRELLQGGHQRALDGGFDGAERQLVTRTGKVVETQLHTRPETDIQGAVIGTRAMFVNISRRKRIEKKLRHTTEELHNLTHHRESSLEAQRARIAREIHDELGQMLTVLKMDTGWLSKRVPPDQPDLLKKLDTMSTHISATIQSVQRITAELRPGMLDNLGLVAAMQWQLQEFESRTDIRTKLVAEQDQELELDGDLAIAIFRIFQEALTNVARHAQATELTVTIAQSGNRLTLIISDNGIGINEAALHSSFSFGLLGMRERMHPWQGQIAIQGEANKGTTLRLSVPLYQVQEGEHHDPSTHRR